ncbi:MAG TPA: class I SAM-dependent methyltransferase [Hyphomicrobiales bacterium]|nr:class I SAM-dependent methyltransferase [Hyphomicrobiales bacterium]
MGDRHGGMEPCMRAPSPWVLRFLRGVRPAGTMLDVACGGGRHLRAALAAGLTVTGIDRNLEDVADLAGRPDVELVEADLENGSPFPLAGRRFDLVVVTNYLWRPLFPALLDALADDGVLVYETFALGHDRNGRPVDPAFLLGPNELLRLLDDRAVVVAYEHGVIPPPPRPKIVQRVAAVGRAHRWANGEPMPLG